jgi:hypothetical protein
MVARAESCVRSNACKCGRTQITARAGSRLRANVGCCVRPWCCRATCDRGAARLRATVVLLHAWVRSNAPSAVERTMAVSSL